MSNSPPARIIFHAGFHKTGTTSLQKSLVAHQPLLGVSIKVETRATSNLLTQAAEAARRYSIQPNDGSDSDLRHALTKWADGLTLQADQQLLVSSEDFSGHMPGNKGAKDYSAAPAIAAAIAAVLTQRFGDGLALSLLYTVREANAWLRSIHWQIARHPTLDLTADRFCRRYAKAADFASTLAGIGRDTPGIALKVVALEDLITRRLGPVEALYDLAGLSDALRHSLPPLPPANRRPPVDLADVFVAMNKAGMSKDQLKRLKLRLLAAAEMEREADT